ncbi:tail protein X [Asticcacaulis sp. BYS171W]|uniref:Tail protein X n=1 Tax=Asticcacaulis aquaticus TaxID=2984212 RepID=A0ABT5HT95_9CAUL|nr:tail protein X [Asticcacaulis aquaticus]MDC7683280.1 tail protein X [Asticcacaulis aquaticus]
MASTFTAAAHKNETLDALVWRVLKRGSPVVEQVLQINRDIASIATALPEGQIVTLPVLKVETVKTTEIVQLWD